MKKRNVRLGLWFAVLTVASTQISAQSFSIRWTNAHIVREIGLFGYVVYEGVTHALAQFHHIDDVDPAPYRAFVQQRRARIDASVPARPAPQRRRNVVFLQLESIDAVTVDATLQGEPVMPFLRSLRERSIEFTYAIDQTSSGRSADAHVLALTSQIPIHNEAIFTRYDLSKIPSLPRVLTDHGYHSISLEGYQGEFWRWKINHARLGVQESFSMTELDRSDMLGWGISDRSIVAQAADRFTALPTPFFAHILLLSHHHPFNFIRESQGGEDRGLLNDYLIGSRYTDGVIELLFQRLEQAGLLEDTLVAVFSDHDSGATEEVAEHLGHPYHEGVEHERIAFFLYDGGRAETIDKPVGLQDLPVTILDALGIPAPPIFLGIPARSPYADVLLPNGQRVTGLDAEGLPMLESIEVDMRILTQLAIDRPEDLNP